MNSSDSADHFSARKTLRDGLPQFIGFEVLYRLLGAILFTPLVAWLTARLIQLSGSGAISNYDIAGYLLSFKGQLYLTIVVSLGFALTFFEFGGLLALALTIHRGATINLPQLLRFLILSLPKLWRLSVRQFLTYLAIAIPCLAITGLTYLKLLTESDINYYLIAKPKEFWITVAVATGCGLAFLYTAGKRFLDWIFSIPLVLFTDAGPAQALKESTRLSRPHRKELVKMFLRWLAFTAMLFLALSIIMFVLKWILLGLAGNRVGLVLSMTAIIAVVQFIIASLIGILASSSLACMIAKRFIDWGPEPQLPDSLSNRKAVILEAAAKMLKIGWVVALIFAALSVFAAKQIIGQNQITENVGITAHRGSSITAPENTMAAIMLAVEEGSDFVEIDVQETSDGTIVLVHDKDLLRVFGIKKGIWEVSFDELKDLDSGGWFSPEFSDQRLATLDQVIKAVKGKSKLNIELKFNGHQKQLAKEVVRIVRENDFAEDCILTSLDYAGIQRARAAGPELRTGIIVTSAIGDVTKLEGDLISVSAGTVTRDLIDRAHHAELEVHVWTVNKVQQMNKMIGMGVDQIITDDPKLLGEVIKERAALSPAELTLLRLADIAESRF
ncbi:glycerophosphodiester phosphodiesterase family protein [Haloferula sp.]|uniref:glycerophosphodiester phosphodiesterase family protein n=1 Tax=Haloferula sp. TaxID=2497595 RepID=UPI00329F926B